MIFTFGILHGANDLLLIKKNNSPKKTYNFIKSLLNYVLVIIFCAILFYFIPGLTLILFILVSAFHFGEQQWIELIKNYPKWISYSISFTYGLFIFMLLFIAYSLYIFTLHQSSIASLVSFIVIFDQYHYYY